MIGVTPLLVLVACALLGGAWGRARDRRRGWTTSTLAGLGLVAAGLVLRDLVLMSVSRIAETTCLAVVCASITIVYHLLMRAPRRAPGTCGRCGYATHGLRSTTCPECGYPIDAPVAVISDGRRVVFILLSTALAVGAGIAARELPSYRRWTHQILFNDVDGLGSMRVSTRQHAWVHHRPPLRVPPPTGTKPTTFAVEFLGTPPKPPAGPRRFTVARATMTTGTLTPAIRGALPSASDATVRRTAASVSAAVAADCRQSPALQRAARAGTILAAGGAGWSGGTVLPAFALAWSIAAIAWVLLAWIFRRTAPLVRPSEPLPSVRSAILGPELRSRHARPRP